MAWNVAPTLVLDAAREHLPGKLSEPHYPRLDRSREGTWLSSDLSSALQGD
jgi:hypothetical protein